MDYKSSKMCCFGIVNLECDKVTYPTSFENRS